MELLDYNDRVAIFGRMGEKPEESTIKRNILYLIIFKIF